MAEETGATPYPMPEVPALAAAPSHGPPIEGGALRVTARVRVAFQLQ